MQDDVYFYHAEATGEKLASAMTMGGFGSVPVVDKNRRLIGIVTEFDLLKAIMEGKQLPAVTAREILTPSPLTVAPDTPAMEVIRLLGENHLIRMPVVDQVIRLLGENHLIRMPVVDLEGKLLGVVARRDILEGYLKATTQMWWF
jgi:CBS domain-containing protein